MDSFVLSNATIIDGTGAAPFAGAVIVAGGRIAEIARGPVEGDLVHHDLGGLALAPGFIDIHTHSDFTLLVDGSAESQIRQGVTTEVVGNCGHSCAPAQRPDRIARQTFGHHASVPFTWTSFGGYLERLEAARPAVNVAAFVGHGALRLCVMEEPQGAASPDEVKQMRSLLQEALDAGAVGFTTGLEYAPGNAADPQEIVTLCRDVAARDRLYATHIRNRDYWYEMGLGEALSTARQTGVRLQVSHLSPKHGAPVGAAAQMVEMIGWTRDAGIDAAFDVIPHNFGPTTMSSLLPPWVFVGGLGKALKRLSDKAAREAIKANPEPMWKLVKDRRWADIILFNAPANLDLMGLDFAEIGRLRNQDPYDAALDLLREEGDGLFGATWLARQFTDPDQDLLMRHELCGIISDTITLSSRPPLDAVRWSPSTWGWTARFLTEFADRRRLMALPEAVRRLTAYAADRVGLKDRGRIAVGMSADLVVFDPAALADRTSLKQPNAAPAGIRDVIVNGAFALHDGQLTDARSGLVLRAH
jgi:N-acyl-D-aspartate/D-glutamate deacylase